MRKFAVIGLVAASLSLLLCIIGETAIEDSLVLYFPFDEVEGDTVEDKSGKNNDGVINGKPELIEGKFEKALEFNGVDSFVEVQDSESLNPTAGTVSVWVKVYEKVQYGGFIDKWQQDAGFKGYLLQSSTGYPVGVLIGSGDAYKAIRMEDAPMDSWIHVALTWDGKTMAAYLDGEEHGTEDVEMAPAVGPMFIGKRVHGANAFFNGAVDEVAVFNKVLSSDEIQSVMNGGIFAVQPSGKTAVTWGVLKDSLVK
jgi:hypothetical protein